MAAIANNRQYSKKTENWLKTHFNTEIMFSRLVITNNLSEINMLFCVR